MHFPERAFMLPLNFLAPVIKATTAVARRPIIHVKTFEVRRQIRIFLLIISELT